MPTRPYGSPANFDLLRAALAEKDANETTPGRTPSGIAENAYFSSIPRTSEQEREATDYAALDEEANTRHAAQSEALTAGFGSPAEALAKGYEQKKVLAGEPARVAGEASIKAAGARSDAQLEAIKAMLAGGQGDRALSVSGVGSVGTAPKPPTPPRGPAAAEMNKVVAARQAMQSAEPGALGRMLGHTNPNKPAYDQALSNALQTFHPQARQAATDLLGRYGKKSPHELISAAHDEGLAPGSPEEDELYNVLSLMTGQP